MDTKRLCSKFRRNCFVYIVRRQEKRKLREEIGENRRLVSVVRGRDKLKNHSESRRRQEKQLTRTAARSVSVGEAVDEAVVVY